MTNVLGVAVYEECTACEVSTYLLRLLPLGRERPDSDKVRFPCAVLLAGAAFPASIVPTWGRFGCVVVAVKKVTA